MKIKALILGLGYYMAFACSYATRAEDVSTANPDFSWRRPCLIDGRIIGRRNFGRAICLSDDGGRLLAGFSDGEAVLFSLPNKEITGHYNFNKAYQEKHPEIKRFDPVGVGEVAFVEQGKHCVVISEGAHLPFRGFGDEVLISPNETLVFLGPDLSSNGSWHFEQFPGMPRRVPGGYQPFQVIQFSADNTSVLEGLSNPGNVALRERASGKVSKEFKLDGQVRSLAIGPASKWCAVGFNNFSIEPDAADRIIFNANKMPPGTVAQPLIPIGQGSEVAVVELDHGNIVRVQLGHALSVIGVKILNDGETCVSVSMEGMIVVWSIHNQKVLRRFWAGGAISHFDCDPSGSIAAVGNSSDIRLFDLNSGHVLEQFEVASKDYKPIYPDSDKTAPKNLPEPLRNDLAKAIRDDLAGAHLAGTPQHHIADISLNGTTRQIAFMYLDGLLEIWNQSKQAGNTQIIRLKRQGLDP